MSPFIKNLIITFSLYGSLYGLAILLNSVSSSGPCTPGGGILFIMFIIPIVTIVFFLTSLIMVINKRKDYLLSLFVSAIIMIVALTQFLQR